MLWIHLLHLLLRRRAEDLDDLHELLNCVLAREEGLTENHLRDHSA